MASTIFSRGFLLELLDHAPFLIQIFSGGGKTLFQNSTSVETRKISGLDGYLAGIHPADRERSFRNWESALSDKFSMNQEVRYLGKDNKYRWYIEKIVVIENIRTGMLIDVNEFKNAEEQKVLSIIEVTQDIRIPLTSARSRIKNLFSQSPGMNEVMMDLERAVEILTTFHDRNLPPSLKGILLNLRLTDLSQEIESVLADFRKLYGPRYLFSPVKGCHGWWDTDRVKQIFEIILSNAQKYGKQGALVEIVLKPELNSVALAVLNNGSIIPPEDSLTKVREYCDSHGGTFQVEMSAEDGTVFNVILPRDLRQTAK